MMKRYIKSTQSIFAGYSCNGWFNILKNQKIPEYLKWGTTEQREWDWAYNENHPNYTPGGYEAVRKYTGSGHRDINNYLRGKPYKNDWWESSPEEAADNIHKVISKVNLPKDIVTIRHTDIENLEAYLGKGSAENISNGQISGYIGCIITESGFCSTSMSRALDYVGFEKIVEFILLLPKGTPAIYIWDVTSHHEHEFEVLLQNNTSFIIRDIQYSDSGFDTSSGLRSNAKYRIFMEKI